MKKPYYIHALATMYDLYKERRTDVADFCEMVLNDTPIDELREFQPEARFIEAGVDNIVIQYDTLTTLLHISFDEGKTWFLLKTHKYLQDVGQQPNSKTIFKEE